MFRSITNKIAVMLIISLVVSFAAISAVSYYTAESKVVQLVSQNQAQILKDVYAVTESFFQDYIDTVKKLGVNVQKTQHRFLMGGISIVHKIETLSLFAATTIHVISLYAVVTATYMFNGWLLMTARWLTVYTLGFLAAYAIIWIFIYLLIRRRVTKMNRQIQG